MKKETKNLRVDELSAVFAANSTLYLFDYTKMKVSQATALRKRLRAQGASLKVVKNRLALRALAERVPAELRPAFRKPTAVAYTAGQPDRPGQDGQGVRGLDQGHRPQGRPGRGHLLRPRALRRDRQAGARGTELLGKIG